jgi:glucokinase
MISRILHLVIIDILAVGVAIRRAAPKPGAKISETVAKARQSGDDDAAAVLDWLSHGASGMARD